jgi:hypothetical protein
VSGRQVSTTKKGNRIFTDEQLKEFSKGYMHLAMEGIDAGDLDKARHWCQREADTNSQIHDLLVSSVAGFISFIYDRLGEDAAVEAVRKTMGQGASPELIELRKKGPKEWILWCVDMWRQHATDPGVTVEEDDEKFTLTVKCGSGGKLVEIGAYDGPDGLRRLQKAGPHTWGETGLPVYCSHCPWVHEIIPIKMGGQGSQFWVHVSPFPKKPGDPCIHHVYKNPDDIPEKYYGRLGMKKEGK